MLHAQVLHNEVYCSIICNSEDLETSVPISKEEWLSKSQNSHLLESYRAVKLNQQINLATSVN